MMPELADLLLETGLLQFGRFLDGKADPVPYRLNLDLLPSYPDILRRLAVDATSLIGEADHLLSPASALPFGLSVSLKTGIPLVYSRGTGRVATYDLAGAYDIGHPAILLTNTLDETLPDLIQASGRVGLVVRKIVTVVDERAHQPPDVPMKALIDLPGVIDQLISSGSLPGRQGKVVKAWVQSNRHPG